MGWDIFKKRAGLAGGGRLVRFVLPRVVYEIEPGYVVGARLDGRSRQLRRLSVRELPAGGVEPAPHRANVLRLAEVRAALRGLAPIVGNGNGSCGLLIPDAAVRVGIVGFETLPEDRADADALVRWRMRENLPAPPEDVRLSWQILRREPRSVELLVVAVKDTVLAEYEQLLEPVNGSLALVLPATMALLPLLPEHDAAQMLLHICAGWMTAVAVEGDRTRLWRTVELRAAGAGELTRQVAFEAARIVESARDNRRIEIERVLLAERPQSLAGLEDEIGRAIAREVVRLAPDAAMGRKLSEAEQPVYENFGAAVAGLVANVG